MRSTLSLLVALVAALAAAVGAAVVATAAPAPKASATAPHQATGPAPSTRAFLAASDRAERRGYLRRTTGKRVELQGWISREYDTKAASHDGGGLVIHTGPKPSDVYDLAVPDSASVAQSPITSSTSAATSNRAQLAANDVATVSGTLSGGTVTVSSAQVTSTLPSPVLGTVATPGARPVQSRRILVILANFQADRDLGLAVSEPATREAAQAAMFSSEGGARSLRNLYFDSSRGNLVVTGDVTPWTKLTIPKVDCSHRDEWLDAAQTEVRRVGAYDPDAYDVVMLVVPSGNDACSYQGVAFDGRYNVVRNRPGGFETATAVHEFGHLLGLHHAGINLCTKRGVRVPMSARCTSPADAADPERSRSEYGDPYDPMGNPEVTHSFNAFHRAALGFLPLSSVKPLPADGAYYPVAGSTSSFDGAPQLRRYRRATAEPDSTSPRAWYYAEYRRPSAPFDQFRQGSAVESGVTLSLGLDVEARPPMYSDTFIVNASAGRTIEGNANARRGKNADGTASDADMALLPGQSYWDPVENVTFTAGTVEGETIGLKVTPGPPTGDGTTVSVVGETLRVTSASGHRNVIGIGEDDGQVIVTDAGRPVTPGGACEPVDQVTVACSKTAVRRVRVDTGDRDDSISIADSLGVPATLIGGIGNDAIESGPQDDRFESGTSDDGSDVISAGYGADTVSYAERSTPVTVDANVGGGQTGEKDLFVGPGNIARLEGGSAGDTISATAQAPHVLVGGGGIDRITGGPGEDRIIARDGLQETDLDCGAGNDVVIRDANDAVGTGCEDSMGVAQAEIISGPAEGTSTASAQPPFAFAAAATPNPQFQCKIESGATPGSAGFQACPANYTPAVLSEGPKVLSVRAAVNGSASGTVETRAFTVDKTPPNTTITNWPSVGDATDSAIVSTSTEATATFECRLGRADTALTSAFMSCPATKHYRLAAGRYTVEVRAVDRAGNVDSTPASKTWAVAPETVLDSAPDDNGLVYTSQPTVRFHAEPATGSSLKCAFGVVGESASYESCASPFQPAVPLALSTVYELRVAAVGADGSVDPTPIVRRWIGVAAPFETTITSGPTENEWTADTTPTFEFAASGPNLDRLGGYQCQVNGGAWEGCWSPFTLPAQLAGKVTFAVRSLTSHQLPDETPAERTFWIGTPPELSVSAPVTSPTSAFLSSDATLGPSLDWIHWRGSTSDQFDRFKGAQLINTWTPIGSTTPVATTGRTTFAWSNAAGSTAAGSANTGVGAGPGTGRGFRVTVPASATQTRKLRLWVGVRGAATLAQLRLSLPGASPVISAALPATSATTQRLAVYTVTFRAGADPANLTASWLLSSGGAEDGAQAVLYAAALT